MKTLLTLICLIAFSAQAKDIPLAWDHNGECQEYRIYRSQGSSDYPERVGTVNCPTTTFTDLNVPNGTLSYIVTAFDEVESNASNEVELAYYYARTEYDYDASGRLIYIGENQDINAAHSDTDWVVTKIYYNANGSVSLRLVRTTSWTDRANGW